MFISMKSLLFWGGWIRVPIKKEETGWNVKGGKHFQSPMLWSPLTSRIDLCKCLTDLQHSCKTPLWSRFCFLEAIFLLVYIFSCDIKYDIIIFWVKNSVWSWQYIYRDYIDVYLLQVIFLCIHQIEWKHWSDLLRTMSRALCLGTAKCIF